MNSWILFLLTICLLVSVRIVRPNSILSNTCENFILNQYNVKRSSCSVDFIIEASTQSYTLNEPIHISIRTTNPNRRLVGVIFLAQNSKNENVGNWRTSESLVDNIECGGVMHRSKVETSAVSAVWYPTSDTTENIKIKSIIIGDDNVAYLDCYNTVLSPRIQDNTLFTDQTDVTSNPITVSSSTTMTTTVTTTAILTSTTRYPGNTTRTPSPTAEVSVNVTWTFTAETSVTNVHMTVNNLKSGQWAAIGLGLEEAMGEAHVFMCKRLANDSIVLHRYINPDDHEHPEHAGSEQGGVLTPGQQQFNDGAVICQFTLSNFNSTLSTGLRTIRPLSQSTSYHPLFAIGLLRDTNEPQKHFGDSRIAQSDLVQLNQNKTILYKVKTPDNGDPLKFLRVHGGIMTITWMLIVSTGTFVSRYFKTSMTNKFICGKAPWFAIHRFLMTISVILVMLGFLFILVFNQGTWVEQGPTRAFAHSITGVLAISLAFFQPFIAIFRCEPNTQYRYIFNFIHRYVGVSANILSVAALFLATYFHILKDTNAQMIMIIWMSWFAFAFIAFEMMRIHFQKKRDPSNYSNINTSSSSIGNILENPAASTSLLTPLNNEVETVLEQKSKNTLLAIHILMAGILSVILTIFICSP